MIFLLPAVFYFSMGKTITGTVAFSFDREFIARFDGLDFSRKLFGGFGDGHDDRIRLLDLGHVGRRGMVLMDMGDQDQVGLGPFLERVGSR